MTPHEPILARLAALKAMSVKDLKAEWQTLFKAQLALIMRAVRSVGFLRRRRVSRGEFGVLE